MIVPVKREVHSDVTVTPASTSLSIKEQDVLGKDDISSSQRFIPSWLPWEAYIPRVRHLLLNIHIASKPYIYTSE
jgi:hypothetical protein